MPTQWTLLAPAACLALLMGGTAAQLADFRPGPVGSYCRATAAQTSMRQPSGRASLDACQAVCRELIGCDGVFYAPFGSPGLGSGGHRCYTAVGPCTDLVAEPTFSIYFRIRPGDTGAPTTAPTTAPDFRPGPVGSYCRTTAGQTSQQQPSGAESLAACQAVCLGLSVCDAVFYAPTRASHHRCYTAVGPCIDLTTEPIFSIYFRNHAPTTDPPSGAPTAPTAALSTPPTAAPSTPAHYAGTPRLEIVSGSAHCEIDDDGCATDGNGNYGANEDCTIRVAGSARFLSAVGTFDIFQRGRFPSRRACNASDYLEIIRGGGCGDTVTLEGVPSLASVAARGYEGVYTLVPDVTRGGRPVYRRSDNNSLYFDTSGNRWRFGPSIDGTAGLVHANPHLDGRCPQSGRWQAQNSNGNWVSSSDGPYVACTSGQCYPPPNTTHPPNTPSKPPRHAVFAAVPVPGGGRRN